MLSNNSNPLEYYFYEYNPRGLLRKVFINTSNSKPVAYEALISYNPDGSLARILYKGPKNIDYDRNIRGWVKAINEVYNPQGNFSAKYIYFNNGNIKKALYYNPSVSGLSKFYHYRFTYDNLNRLLSADYGPGDSGSSSRFDVSGLNYDDAGNITSLLRRNNSGGVWNNLTYNYNSTSNRLQSVTDGAGSLDASFTYDANGYMISQSGKFSDINYEHRNLPAEFINNYRSGCLRLIQRQRATHTQRKNQRRLPILCKRWPVNAYGHRSERTKPY